MSQKTNYSEGSMIVISGPSGVGKSTLSALILKNNDTIKYSVSYTTRKKRINEVDGKDYYFVSREAFLGMIKENEFLEYAEVFNNFYGTGKKIVDNILKSGNNVLLEIDVQGGKQILEKHPEACSIFILPPSIEELQKRFIERGTDSNEQKIARFNKAQWEIEHKYLYKYHVINDSLDKAYSEIMKILHQYRIRN